MTITGKVTLKKGKEVSLQRFHPWVFSGAIHNAVGAVDGAWVEVQDYKSQTLGYGHYQRQGSISVRILTFEAQVPDERFYERRLDDARFLRTAASLPSADTNAFRLIHAEGDGLPGLIVDWYDGVAVVQAHSSGMHADRERIAAALGKVFGEELKAVYYKSKSTLGGNHAEDTDAYLSGLGAVPHVVNEYKNKFYIDWEEGQKTGFFLDQRENRKLLTHFTRGKTVLNTFCYTGGFSVYALAAGASIVHSVDASEKAIELTRKNLTLNGYNPAIHECHAVDTFEFLKDKEDVYDVIVLDPPAFAKHRDARHQAVKGYQRLNTEAMKVIKPGGILFTFSCSQVVDRQLFYDTIVSSAIQAKRQIKVLHHLAQPADHPVSIFHREGEYLKGLVLYVE